MNRKNRSKDVGGGKKRKGGKIFLLILLILILIIAALLTLDYFDIVDFSFITNRFVDEREIELSGEVLDDEDYRVEAPDAEAYFENNSDVVSKEKATESADVQTMKDARDHFDELGFDGKSIVSDYSIDGEYGSDDNDDPNAKHPVYQCIYENSSGQAWIIYSVNGKIMANPLSYNMERDREAGVFISESETIMSYDGTTNMFFETIPDESVMTVKVVEKINASTLDELTYEAIDSL